MSLPVVVHFNQRFCLLLESNCLIDDQIQKTRHLIDDFKRSFFVVIDKAFVNAVITKVTAGVSGFSKLLRKTKSINSGSQIATFDVSVFTESFKRKAQQARCGGRRAASNALGFVIWLKHRHRHVFRWLNCCGIRPYQLLVNKKGKAITAHALFNHKFAVVIPLYKSICSNKLSAFVRVIQLAPRLVWVN